jgi:hypothetical protein
MSGSSRRVSYFYDAEIGNHHYGQGMSVVTWASTIGAAAIDRSGQQDGYLHDNAYRKYSIRKRFVGSHGLLSFLLISP